MSFYLPVMLMAWLLFFSSASAATVMWTGTTDSLWSESTNWDGSAPMDGNDVILTGAGVYQPTNLNILSLCLHSLIFDSTTTSSITINTGNSFTLGSGGLNVENGAFSHTIGLAITLSANQTWTHSSTNTFTMSGAIANGGYRLTVTGSGNTSIRGSMSGSEGLTKTGTGILSLAAANTYNGTTQVSGGVLLLDDANALPGGVGISGGTSPLVLSGGVIGLTAVSGDFTRSLGSSGNQVKFTSNGGFAAFGGNRTVNLGGNATPLNWWSGNFVASGNLILGAATADSTVTFVNPINLGMTDHTVQVERGISIGPDAILSGVISGIPGGLRKTGPGVLSLTGSNTYLGLTIIDQGVLLQGSAGAIGSAAPVTFTNATTPPSGVLGLGVGDFTRGLGTSGYTVQWTGNGGFAAYGADRTVTISNNAALKMKWNNYNDGFLSGNQVLILGASSADKTVTFVNPLDLCINTGQFRSIQVDDGTAAMDAILAGNLTNSGTVTAGNVFYKSGAGTLLLAGNNARLTGNTVIQNGALAIGTTQSLSASTVVTVGNLTTSGKLILGNLTNATDLTLAGLQTSGTGTANRVVGGGSSTANLTLNLAAGKTYTFNGTLGGTLSNEDNLALIVTGSGKLILGGASTYSGNTTIQNSGVTLVGGDNRLPATTTLTLGAGSTGSWLMLGDGTTSSNQTLAGLVTAGPRTSNWVVGGGKTCAYLTLNIASGTNTFSGSLGQFGSNASNLALIKTGNGTLVLTGTNYYTGGTVITGGTLAVSEIFNFGTGNVTVIGENSILTNSGNLYMYMWQNDVGYPGYLRVENGGLVTSQSLYASLDNLRNSSGNGTVNTNGWVADANLVFDAAHGLQQSFPFGTGGVLHLTINGSGQLGAGYTAAGTLTVSDGMAVTNTSGYLGYWSGSTGRATVAGAGSSWTNHGSLNVGFYGTGNLTITEGGKVSNAYGTIGSDFGSTGAVTVTGNGSGWINRNTLEVGYIGTGNLTIANGGKVTARSMSINSWSSVNLRVSGSDMLVLGNNATLGSITNNGTINLYANTFMSAGIYTPISEYAGRAMTWSGNGTYHAVGGTWDDLAKTFTVAPATLLSAGETGILTAGERVLISASGLQVGASFGADVEGKSFSASLMTPAQIDSLQALLPVGQTVLSGWNFNTDLVGSTVLLSYNLGHGLTDLGVWHYDGAAWTSYAAGDLLYDANGIASFTVSSFSGYALSGGPVPEPATLVLLGLGLVTMAYRRRAAFHRHADA